MIIDEKAGIRENSLLPGAGNGSRCLRFVRGDPQLLVTVKLKQSGPNLWRVSVVRDGAATCSVVRGWERASALAWRAVALISRWNGARPASDPPSTQRRYIVIDTSFPSEDPPLHGGHEGQVLATFGSLEKAQILADEELAAGNQDVAVIDRGSGERVYPRVRVGSSPRSSAPPSDEAASA